MSEATDRGAVLAAINAQFPSKTRAYAFGDPAVKALTSGHILVLLYRRYTDGKLLSGEAALPGGRVVTRYVGTSFADVDAFRAATKTALEDKILAGGVGPFSFETADAIDDEVDGSTTWFYSSDTWTF